LQGCPLNLPNCTMPATSNFKLKRKRYLHRIREGTIYTCIYNCICVTVIIRILIMMQSSDERLPLSGKKPAPRLARVGAALCAAACVAGVYVAGGGGVMVPAAVLKINEDNIDDGQRIQCVGPDLAYDFMLALGASLAGWKMLPSPVGATFLLDRGSFTELHGFPRLDQRPHQMLFGYDWAVVNARIVAGYDALLDVGNPTAPYDGSLNVLVPEWNETCALEASGATPCVETCVEDRFLFIDDGAYNICSDPVEAAFVYAPDLVKSCLVETPPEVPVEDREVYNMRIYGKAESCWECINLCITTEEFGNRTCLV